MIEAQPPSGEQSNPYLPAGPPDPLIFEAFEGINTATLRPGVDDKQAAWLDCFMPLGPGRNLRTMYDVGPALFTPADGDTIVFFDFFNISTTPYMLAIVTSGEIYAVNTNTGASTSIAPPAPSPTPCAPVLVSRNMAASTSRSSRSRPTATGSGTAPLSTFRAGRFRRAPREHRG